MRFGRFPKENRKDIADKGGKYGWHTCYASSMHILSHSCFFSGENRRNSGGTTSMKPDMVC
jgi:hypothetical protein